MPIKLNKEESLCDAYYDAEIQRIATRAEIVERGNLPNARQWWMGRFFADMGRLQKLEDDDWCEKNCESTITFAVEDNGANGDGMRLSVRLTGTGAGFGEPDDGDLIVVDLAPEQAAVLAQALHSIARMRSPWGMSDCCD